MILDLNVHVCRGDEEVWHSRWIMPEPNAGLANRFELWLAVQRGLLPEWWIAGRDDEGVS